MKKSLKKFISMLLILSMCSVTVYADDGSQPMEGISQQDMQLDAAVEPGGDLSAQPVDPAQPEEPIQPDDPAQPEEPIQQDNPGQPGDTIQPDDREDDLFQDLDQNGADDGETPDGEDPKEEDPEKDLDDSEEEYQKVVVEDTGSIYIVRKNFHEESGPESEIALQSDSDETEIRILFEVEERVKTALKGGMTSVDISDMNIDPKKYDLEFLDCFSPYFGNGIQMEFYASGRRYGNIQLTNSNTPAQTTAYFTSVEAKVNEILKQADGLAPEQKALVVHDYFVNEYQVDTSVVNSCRSSNLLINGRGGSQAYAYGFMYIMAKLGIECHVTISESMNHAWNIIGLGNKNYHVDCAGDDPSPDKLGKVYHGYFLVSDQAVRQLRNGEDSIGSHSGWEPEYYCDDRTYDDGYWKDAKSQIIIKDNKAYYILDDGLYSCSGDGISEERVSVEFGKWPNGADSDYRGVYSGLFFREGYLYYNTATELRKIGLNGSGDELVYKPSTSISDGYIYGCREHNGEIEYAIAAGPKSVQRIEVAEAALGCKITFDLDGGKIESAQEKVFSPGEHYGELPVPTKDGYVFKGWYTANEGGEKIEKNSTVPNVSKQTLYARWSAKKYKITYKLDGGTKDKGWDYPTTYTYTVLPETIELKGKPEKDGYDFGGWYSDNTWTKKETQIKKNSTGDKIFYAKWNPKKYSVKYDLDGGNNASGNPSSYTVETDPEKLKLYPPAKTGYTFKGWYTDKAKKTKVTQIAKGSTGNKKFYAKWAQNSYTIQYNENTGSGSMKEAGLKFEKKYTLPKCAFKKKGYKFSGWATNPKGPAEYQSGQEVQGLASKTKNKEVITLYAQWTKQKYSITYIMNGGKNDEKNKTRYTVTSEVKLLDPQSRTGYTFKGWYTTGDNEKKITKIPKGSTGNISIYAKWAENSYKIQYNKNGGSGSMKATSCKYSKTYKLSKNTFKRKGYTFAGWATSKKGKVVYKNTQSVKKLVKKNGGTITLYAVWKKK